MVYPYIMGLLSVLFPQVRAEVLRLLFAEAGRELHLRELPRQSGLRVAMARVGREINAVTMTAAKFAKKRKNSPFLANVLAKEKLFVKGSADEFERLGQGRVVETA